jgi:acyl-CoA reductase-like NAD-dependent aldehyde dehydrogenase
MPFDRMKQEFSLLISGELLPGKNEPFAVIDPSTALPVTVEAPHASQEQVNQAVESAFEAFKEWSTKSLQQRQSFLSKAVESLKPHIREISTVLSQEQGKPLANATSEVESAIAAMQDATKIDIPVTKVGETDKHILEIHRKPIGVVAAIIPWNYPIYIALMKIAHSLVFGNTIVVKPSPYTPLSTLKVGEIIAPIFPRGVVNIITGPDTRDEKCVGDQLSRHRLVKLCAFTGSIPTGKRVFSNSAAKMARMVLELGGNDAAIVLKDANVAEAAQGVFEAGMINSGQICCGIKRVYVDRKIYDEFVSRVAELAKAKTSFVGAWNAKEASMGPLNNRAQFQRVAGLVEDAVENGGTVLVGGKRPSNVNQEGFFYEPTIITNVKEGVRIVDEEQFGPVLPIMSFDSEEEAITRANQSNYGLGASVWGTDPEAVNRVARQLEAGLVWTNEHAADAPGLAFGGFKESGFGREGGDYDLLTYTEPQSVKLLK